MTEHFLPPEIWSSILLLAAEGTTPRWYSPTGTGTLRSAASVSRYMNAIATPLLYRSIGFHWTYSVAEAFLRTANSAPEVLAHVKSFRVEEGIRTRRDGGYGPDGGSGSALFGVVARMARLEHIRIVGFDFSARDAPPLFLQLRHLELDSCLVEPHRLQLDDTFSFFRKSFGHLEHLVLGPVLYGRWGSPTLDLPSTASFSSLRFFETPCLLGGSGMERIVATSAKSLVHLKVHRLRRRQEDALGALLAQAGQLETLSFGNGWHSASKVPPLSSLSAPLLHFITSSSTITHLSIDGGFYPDLLASLPFSLESLSIFRPSSTFAVDSLIELLDQISGLKRARCTALCKVVLKSTREQKREEGDLGEDPTMQEILSSLYKSDLRVILL